MKKIAFVGSKVLGLDIVREIYRIEPDSLCAIITIDDSQDVRTALADFRHFGEQVHKPLYILTKGSELAHAIAETKPDLCIVAGWYWILSAELLRTVPDGWLGLHASLLPENRGSSPLVWAVIKGQSETGVSLFYFDQGMDTGDVVAQRKFPIQVDDTIAEVLGKAEMASTEVIRETLPLLIQGNAPRVSQDHSRATFIALRKPSDGKINWNWPGLKLYNFIRAQAHPYPGAFCQTASGDTLTIWKVGLFPYPYNGSPGQVAMVEPDAVIVTTGDACALRLFRIQLVDQPEVDAVKLLKFGQRLQ